MNLQETVLTKFKAAYPGLSLKEVAELTGIQVTRVFRIFNGSEMKLKEFEVLEKILQERNESGETFVQFQKVMNSFYNSATHGELQELMTELSHSLSVKSILRGTSGQVA